VYAWIRDDHTISQRLLVILNMGRGEGRGSDTTWTVPEKIHSNGAKLLITNGEAKEGSGLEGKVELGKFEGRVYLLA
jgi:alpha-glucosidase